LGRQLGQILPWIKETIRHELEHSVQDLSGHSGTPGPAPPMISAAAQLKRMRRYFLDPVEVEAYTVGLVKRAKFNRRPLVNELAAMVKDIVAIAEDRGIDRADAKGVAMEF